MAKNTEIELKLLLSREGLEKMLQLDFMQQAMRPDSYKKRRLVSTYYDTADMTLTQHGIAYRVRDKGDGSFEATVKTSRQSKDGLSERLELNLPLTELKPELMELKERIASQVELRAEERSKFARGLALLRAQ